MKRYPFSWFDWFCLWYPPAWLILFNRHWQHYHTDPDGWSWLEYPLFLIPGGFYLALLIRWVRLGFRSPKAISTDLDPDYQERFREEVLLPIVTRFFRAELQGIEHLPEQPPAIVAMNHAGMCFPWDFICLGVLLSEQTGWFVQPVAHPLFFDHPWLVWWVPRGWAQVLGGVRAEKEHVEAAIAQKKVILYAPESWRGLAKGWTQRYQLATFDPSFIRLSDRYHVPVAPVVCFGNEYLHPWTFNSKWLAKWLGMPLLPVSPLLLLFVLFPSLGVWAMRTRLRYSIQELKFPWKEQLETRSQMYQSAEAVRSLLQSELTKARAEGKSKGSNSRMFEKAGNLLTGLQRDR